MTSNRLEQPESVKNHLPFDAKFNWINYYPTPSLIADKNLQIVHANEAFSKLTGYMPDTLPLDWLRQNINPETLFEPGTTISPRIIPVNTSFGFDVSCCVSIKIIEVPSEEDILLFFLSPPSGHQEVHKEQQPTYNTGADSTGCQQKSITPHLQAFIFNTAELLV